MTHWALKYIGKPWICGKYDCWGLVQDVYHTELGIELSPIVTNASDLRQVFCEFAKETNYNDFRPIANIRLMSEFGLMWMVAVFCTINVILALFFKKRQN